MPATLLSHQALVLPLKMRWPRAFSGLALCIGSMAPDIEFIARMRDDWVVSHTLSAQVWFTIPLTLLLVWLMTTLLLPTLLAYVSEIAPLRLHDLAALEPLRSRADWTRAALSAWLGGMSHVILDGITHGNQSGWLVPYFPGLRTPVPFFGGTVPLHDALQCWLTILFAIAAFGAWRVIARKRLLWHWRGREAQPQRIMARRTGNRLAFVCVLAAAQGAIAGYILYQGRTSKGLLAAVAFGGLDFVFATLVLVAAAIRVVGESRTATSKRRNSRAADKLDS